VAPVVAPAAAIEVASLSHRYPSVNRAEGLLALDDVHLRVGDGEFVALVGPSGCGKSTLLRAAGGLLDPTEGRVAVLGGTPRAAAARRSMGLVTQDPGLLPWRTVAGNVALALEVAGRRVSRERVLELLARVGIAPFAEYHPNELSGGMRQRVALARALAHGPRLLLMDEPFGALDELSREELRLELLRIWERERISVLFVTHSIREAVLLADRVLVMSGRPGRVVADVDIRIGRPRFEALEETPEFAQHVRAIRVALEGWR
jgi:NitT/TauT family transport system ATP-binding protein